MEFKDLQERWDDMSEVEQAFIKASHKLLAEVKEQPEKYVQRRVDPVQLIEDIEFSLQGVWRFTRDADFHTHWLEIKGCTCPALDNADPLIGSRGRIIMQDCPWHGGWE